jgi:hypothetical protein
MALDDLVQVFNFASRYRVIINFHTMMQNNSSTMTLPAIIM